MLGVKEGRRRKNWIRRKGKGDAVRDEAVKESCGEEEVRNRKDAVNKTRS